MPIIGITGGIASGKSQFCQQLLTRVDAEEFDADASAHDLLAHDGEVRRRVTEEVHPDSYGNDNQVNRSLLRETIYRDPVKKSLLEKILHPRIRELWTERAREASRAGRIFIVDIPLLFETHSESLFDHIVTIACSKTTQMRRLVQGRHLRQGMAEQIIASQMPWKQKIVHSHHVVWNDGSLQVLHAQADIFARKLYDRFG